MKITNMKAFEKEQDRIVGMMGVCREKRSIDSILQSLSEQLEEHLAFYNIKDVEINECFLVDCDNAAYYSFRFEYKGNGNFRFGDIVKN